MNLTFAIDGNQVGTFVHEPGPNPDFDYNVLGYSNTTLENTFHELAISTAGDLSLMLFDYLIYTYVCTPLPALVYGRRLMLLSLDLIRPNPQTIQLHPHYHYQLYQFQLGNLGPRHRPLRD